VVYSLIRKTLEERTFQNYLNEKEQRKELTLGIIVRPNGGVRIGLALSF